LQVSRGLGIASSCGDAGGGQIGRGSSLGDIGRELRPCCNVAILVLLLAGERKICMHKKFKHQVQTAKAHT
jgi:hypothetical protein